MPPAVRDAFLARARQQPISRKQVVVAEGSQGRDVYLVLSGRLLFSLVSPQGREVILSDMGPGEMFGELSAIDGQPRSTNVTAIEDSRLAHLTGPEFTQLLGEVPEAGLWVAQQLAQRVRNLTDRAFELATLPVASRVQAELLRLALEVAEPGADSADIRPMPTHAELAARIGTSREAVSRELGLLGQDGLLQQRGRQLHIASLSALRNQYERMLR
ncbi:Crp/Fnr family transcriptional regulator [Novosphingobium sp. B 225]|uniref:Crp/Fnr family transcriptional regulator n=1 Tax=Novosphingobium sp. B 225 TaxID=1961849 RepID=UPI001595FEA7|nr:Crp/Fnr family transcriptional regulator [Novosphingobium sp. B 225]